MVVEDSTDDVCAAQCLLLPGKTLHLSYLLVKKKFKKFGNKDGAVRAFYKLEVAGLGEVIEVGGYKGAYTVRIM